MAKIPVRFVVPILELGPDEEMFQSCVTSIQVSYATVPNVSTKKGMTSDVKERVARAQEKLISCQTPNFLFFNYLFTSCLFSGAFHSSSYFLVNAATKYWEYKTSKEKMRE